MTAKKNKIGKDKDSYRLGQILVQIGAISSEDLQKALNIKESKKDKLLGQILLDEKLCTEDDIKSALHKQRNDTSIGQILLRSEIISEKQINECLLEQEKTGFLLGFVFVDKGYCTSDDLLEALKIQQRDNRLGALLLRENYITEQQLENALLEQQKTNIMLGEILIRMDFITSDDLADILIFQSRINKEFPL